MMIPGVTRVELRDAAALVAGRQDRNGSAESREKENPGLLERGDTKECRRLATAETAGPLKEGCRLGGVRRDLAVKTAG